jgi:eukaryotic-like serine/threonine-protein kinase
MMPMVWAVPGYTEVRELGSGATGRVVLATANTSGIPVAIKYLGDTDAAARQQFRAEARLLADLADPHVVRLYEYLEQAAGAAIVMELVDGVTLRALLRAEGATEPEAALAVLKGSLLGLAAAHRRGVVHRDYKPGNVLIDTVGRTKLADFGIAVPAGMGGAVGTPAYMAPEQWTGAPASPATDIYAATATWYECLTGAQPYPAADLTAMRAAHLNRPVPAQNLPPAVRGLAQRGLAKRPEDRPRDADAFLAELEQTARRTYGAAWERRGQAALARRVAALAVLLPLAGAGAVVATKAAAHTARAVPWLAGAAAAVVLVVTAVGGGLAADRRGSAPAADAVAGPAVAVSAVPVPPSASPSPTKRPSKNPPRTTPPTAPSSAPAQQILHLAVDAEQHQCGNDYCAIATVTMTTLTTDPVQLTLTVAGKDKSDTFTATAQGSTSYTIEMPDQIGVGVSAYCRDSTAVTFTVTTVPGQSSAEGNTQCAVIE